MAIGEGVANAARRLFRPWARPQDAGRAVGHRLLVSARVGIEWSLILALEEGADPDARGDKGETAAMLAAQRGHGDCLQKIIESGADLDARRLDGATAAMLAAERGHGACLQKIIERGADLDAQREDGASAAMLAAELGHVDCLLALMAGGADLDLSDSWGGTAATRASRRGRGDIAALAERRVLERELGADLETPRDAPRARSRRL